MAAILDFVKDPKAENKERLEDFSEYLVLSKDEKTLDEIWDEVHQKLSQTQPNRISLKFPAFRTRQETVVSYLQFPNLLRTQNTDSPILLQPASSASQEIKLKKNNICLRR
ncbi:hypothetical protein HMI54_015844 [Coelomomyces lativittatus]|nr:hypothetical protein HMI56_001151 [Coelomomyces lativittatus]KAJ1512216.1 hypothetical protein HMI54_015844 [Coelomomyces lativittatus]KAJ1516714.1 hypothetical protein HMI55_001595 [Coelomomyces lativittatus]